MQSIHPPFGSEFFPRVIKVEQHHDTGLGIESGERIKPTQTATLMLIAEQPQQPKRAD